jgi:uncharacterized protein (UPF0333 family)
MIHNKRGQGATEYLVILAIVIIIALIVVAAMGGIPGIGSGAKDKASASFWQTADIGFVSFAAQAATDDVNVTVKNNLGGSISSLTVSLDGTALSCGVTALSPGQETKCSHTTVASACTGGGSFSYEVSTTYTDDDTSAAYTYTGEGNKLEGTCAD